MPQPPEPFSCEIDRRDDRVRVRLRGEFDLAAIEEFDAAVTSVTSDGASSVLLDLSAVTFIDSTGLRGVLALHAAAERSNLEFAVVPGPPHVQRVFELAGVDQVVPLAQPRPRGANGSSG